MAGEDKQEQEHLYDLDKVRIAEFHLNQTSTLACISKRQRTSSED